LKTLGPSTESRPQATNFDIYVPSDEIFSPNKLKEIKSNSIQAIVHYYLQRQNHYLIKVLEAFNEILDMLSTNRNQTNRRIDQKQLKEIGTK